MSTSSPTEAPDLTVPRRLARRWHGLIDDAAIFPPGNSPLVEAATAYRDRSATWYAPLVSTFVLTADRLPLLSHHDGAALPVAVVVRGGAEAVPDALDAVAAAEEEGTVVLAGLEVATPEAEVGRVAAACAGRPIPTYVELPARPLDDGWLRGLDAIGAHGLRLKLRTGGTQADQFPTDETLASWLVAGVERDLRFKCTAGLHNAVRHTGGDRFEHHGFLNVLAAVAAAERRGGVPEVTEILATRAPADVAALTRGWADDADAVRQRFVSYGSCSVTEPLADLVALDLLEDAA